MIESDAFYQCNNLKSIDLPESVVTICGGAFAGCSSLMEINIPNSVTVIGGEAYRSCYKLNSICFGNSITIIEGLAFSSCPNIKDVTIKSISPPTIKKSLYGDYCFDSNVCSIAKLFVPAESLDAYKVHKEWGKFTHIVPFIGAGPGDVDGDGRMGVADVTTLIDQLLNGNELPAYADVDGDGNVNISDVTELVDLVLNH